MGRVRYLDFEQELPPRWPSSYYFNVLNKRRSFEHERELRLVLPDFSMAPGRIIVSKDFEQSLHDMLASAPDSSPGHAVHADLSSLIERVYISPLAQPWFGQTIEAANEHFGLACPVERSQLYDRPLY
jgi:hypothetical protein